MILRYFACAIISSEVPLRGSLPQWIAADVDPDRRCGIMEKHWAYFIGFGFPYVVVLKNTSFFVGFGTFLALFPFCIILGSVTDFTLPYRQLKGSISAEKGEEGEKEKEMGEEGQKVKTQERQKGFVAVPLPLFSLAKNWTLQTLKLIDSKASKDKAKEKMK